MALKLRTHVAIPRYDREGEAFNHGDVERESGDVFVTNPGQRSVEILAVPDGDAAAAYHKGSFGDVPGAGGLLCSWSLDARTDKHVFVTAREPGRIRVLDAETGGLVKEIAVGPAPNGLAYDPRSGRLLVADIGDNGVRLLVPSTGVTLWSTQLPGRPRWPCLHRSGDRYLLPIREPAVVVAVDATSGAITANWPISSKGPHGLDIDQEGGRAFVSCDGGAVVALDLGGGHEIASVAIAGGADVTWYNPARGRLYVAIPDPGVVDVVDCASMRISERIGAEPGTRGSAFDPDRQRLYVFLAKTGRVAVYDEAR